ncbi:hypothetical protein GCM10023229_10280 [Flavisolibacter ginsenosidimutans]
MGTSPGDHPIVPMAGGYGVVIFFTLSGFLITYLLLAEKQKQTVDIKKFYVRRILRIWPLYYLYLALVFICLFCFKQAYPPVLPYYLLFAANVPYLLRTPLPFAQHYWSLGVEEQFYLFWPWLVKKWNKSLLTVILSLIALILIAKLSIHFFFHLDWGQIVIDGFAFHCMMIGGATAILYKNGNSLFLKLTDNKISQTVAWLFILAVLINRFHIASILDREIISVVTAVIIIGQVNTKNRLINLEQKGFDFLGKISFGIYIYHPLVIFLTSKLLGPLAMPALPKYLLVYLTVSGLTILIAHLSYNYFESYFLRLKERFAVVKSAATKEAKELRMPRKTEPFQQSTESN